MEWLVLHRVGHDWSELAAAAAVCLLEKGMVPHSSTFAWKIPWTRSLVGCSPWGREESDTIEWLHFHFPLSCIGEGNGNPLQCSFLENPRDAEPSGLPSMGSHRVRHDWSPCRGAAGIWKISVPSQFCCFPKTSLKQIKSFLKKKNMQLVLNSLVHLRTLA